MTRVTTITIIFESITYIPLVSAFTVNYRP